MSEERDAYIRHLRELMLDAIDNDYISSMELRIIQNNVMYNIYLMMEDEETFNDVITTLRLGGKNGTPRRNK